MSSPCKYNCHNGLIHMDAAGWVKCPDCGVLDRVFNEGLGNSAPLYKRLRIPEQYKDISIMIGGEILDAENLTRFSVRSVSHVKSLMNDLAQVVTRGAVRGISFYMWVDTIDIRPFIYSLQKLAISYNLGVTPYISLNTLANMQGYAAHINPNKDNREFRESMLENKREVPVEEYTDEALSNWDYSKRDGKRYVLETGVSYFDYIHSDLCMLEATAATTSFAWSVLADLLAERSREGLPTYVFGYWSAVALKSTGLNYLVAKDRQRLDRLSLFEFSPVRKGTDAGVDEDFERYGVARADIKGGATWLDMFRDRSVNTPK